MKVLRNESSPIQEELVVNAKDRVRQVWERNSLGVPLWTSKVFEQKLGYIHNNPMKAGLCQFSESYKYSSAGFYLGKENEWDFLLHYEG